jgi:hypothetical protein
VICAHVPRTAINDKKLRSLTTLPVFTETPVLTPCESQPEALGCMNSGLAMAKQESASKKNAQSFRFSNFQNAAHRLCDQPRFTNVRM